MGIRKVHRETLHRLHMALFQRLPSAQGDTTKVCVHVQYNTAAKRDMQKVRTAGPRLVRVVLVKGVLEAAPARPQAVHGDVQEPLPAVLLAHRAVHLRDTVAAADEHRKRAGCLGSRQTSSHSALEGTSA